MGLPHDFEGDSSSSHASSNPATYAAPHPASNSPTDTPCDATSSDRPCRPLQLRSWSARRLEAGQTRLVLPSSPCRFPAANLTTTTSRSLQLRRWLCQLAGRLVGRQEGM